MTYKWTDFETVFGKNPKGLQEQSFVHTVSRNRQNLEGILFFDRILNKIGCNTAVNLYPLKSNQDLRKLFDTVISASAQDHLKQAVIYYILKDCKPIPGHGETFATAVYLPRKYKLLMDGLHDLDHSQSTHALELLTNPILPPMFSDPILYTLLQNPKVDNAVAMAYCVSVQPPFEEQKTLNAYFSMLCSMDMFHAYTFCQMRIGSQRKVLFENMIVSALSSKNGTSLSRAEALIGLPFTDQEVSWFEDCLLQGKGSSCHGSKDTVIMRRIATGNEFADVEALHRFRGQRIDGVSWGDVASNLRVDRFGFNAEPERLHRNQYSLSGRIKEKPGDDAAASQRVDHGLQHDPEVAGAPDLTGGDPEAFK